MILIRTYPIVSRWLFGMVNQDTSFLTTPLDKPMGKQSREKAIASYEAHNQRVREVIPSKQLLEYNVREGYTPLCQFLEIENCPTTPFPKTHSKLKMKVQTVSSVAIPFIVSLFVIYHLVRMCCHLSIKILKCIREEQYDCYLPYKQLLAQSRKRLALIKKRR